jgi:hypothetical protein
LTAWKDKPQKYRLVDWLIGLFVSGLVSWMIFLFLVG